jgi:hypothetical protein
MLPRAGFRDLSDGDVAAAAGVRLDDATLVASVTDALRTKVGGVFRGSARGPRRGRPVEHD